MKKGFTLMEMLAVVLIMSIISMVVIPPLYNQIANKKIKIDEASKKIIYTGAKLYLNNNQSKYPKEVENNPTYYVSLDTLATKGYLDEIIINYSEDKKINLSGGEQIPLSYCVKTTVNKYHDYDDFEIVNKCN